ncbi:MAG: CelD/BcsL family acetyltransferase involved in cellulose biosynthesis [Porticoccaceae bacterium]|jgi:CelD/BcsL family acetyltransferase involved in cellulose biosynthesis
MDLNILIETITTALEFDQLEADWTRLHTSSPNCGLFNSWYWNRLWWEHYGDLGDLNIIVVKVHGTIEGIAPLYRCNTRALKIANTETIRFIGSGGDTSPDDLDVIINPDIDEVVVDILAKTVLQLNELGRIQLEDIPEHSPFLKALVKTTTDEGWSLPLLQRQNRKVQTLPSSIEAYEKTLSRNARKQRKRRRRRLTEAGEYKYHLCRTPEEIDLAFDELVLLHQSRHASKGENGSFETARYRDFHRAVMKAALQRDELRLYVLVLNEQTVGIEYTFSHKGVLMFFQNGFDPQFEALSPGHLIMMHIIDEVIKEGAHSMDLLKGDYEYKKSYAKDEALTVCLDIWRSHLVTFASRAVRSLRAA